MHKFRHKSQFIISGLILISINLFFEGYLISQQSDGLTYNNWNNLIQFAKTKSANWEKEKRKADLFARLINIPIEYINSNGKVIVLQRLGRKNKPIYYATDNLDAATIISANEVWTDENNNPFLTGQGIEINLWDGGAVLTSHQELQNGLDSRIIIRERNLTISNHSTHIAGTMTATGINADAKGMAGLATIYGWNFNNDIAEMSIAASEGIVTSNHSYGNLCGWYYNSLSEAWFWYGDTQISELEDYEFGYYDQISADLDYISYNAPNYLIVKSAGNDRNQYIDDPLTPHYVWNEEITNWTPTTLNRDPDGGEDGFDCLTPMSVAKNILTVGAVDDDKLITSFSAYGPTDDGRIKPDVVSSGKDVFSSLSNSFDSYGYYDGTSMAAASVTGSIALLNHLQNRLQPGTKLLSSTIKGCLIHTATEMGSSAGPDYQYGWGLLNIKSASDLIRKNAYNSGKNIIEGLILQGQEISIPIETDDTSAFLKVSICWTDPESQPSSPSLNARDIKLVNDLDLSVVNSSDFQNYLPWVLDVENPSLPAFNGENHLDNIEQICIVNPSAENFNIKISHSGTLLGASQTFSLIISGILTPQDIFPPKHLSFNTSESSIMLRWNSPDLGSPTLYKIYRNDTFIAETTDTSYHDLNVVNDNEYDYNVRALYNWNNQEIESLPTNTITVKLLSFKSLPVIIDFEDGINEIHIKNTFNGWRWGNSESLDCYYLNFDNNSTNFIGIDSYSTGETSHVTDIAATMPLKLAEYENVSISFDYMLVTGLYNAIDELHVVYKLQEEKEWSIIGNLPEAFNWTSCTMELPEEANKNGIQIGFYYDDFYQWGMGAGVDNIQITGTPTRSVDLAITALNSPSSNCSLSENEIITISIRNIGDQYALPGDILNIQMNVSTGVTINDQLILSDTLYNGQLITYQMSQSVDLTNADTYIFDFILSSSLDHNELNNFYKSSVEVYGFPLTQILNTDFSFCENEQPILIQASPQGGTLSGTGISGHYFVPIAAGIGTHVITYTYINLNQCKSSVSKEFIVNATPKVAILNQDLSFCETDKQILIQVTPSGGTLEGPGISSNLLNPLIAGVGPGFITYTYIDNNGCVGISEKPFMVLENPIVNLGPDKLIDLNDTIRLEPSGNGSSFLWYDGSTDDYLQLIAKDFGVGIHDIWIMATSIESCSSIDSILITIENANLVQPKNTQFEPIVYPNPFKEGFYIRLDKQENLEKIFLYGQTGLLIMNNKLITYPYFNASALSPGIYILKIHTSKQILTFQVVKI